MEKQEAKTPEPAPVPFAVHEGALAFARETITRLWVAVILLVVLLAASNFAWLYAWTQYDYVSDTYTQDGEGVNMIGGGDCIYGTDLQEAKANP